MDEKPSTAGGIKRRIPQELQDDIDVIAIQRPRKEVKQSDLDDNVKRWLVVVLCFHNTLSPALRTYVHSILTVFYNELVRYYKIDTQQYPKHLQRDPQTGAFLNYEVVNNNKIKYGKNIAMYNYTIKNAVDLSKLFLQTHMSHYTGFNETCDSSALLGLISNIAKFDPVVKSDADYVRSNIRNPWAHCDFTEWNAVKFTNSFQQMKKLVRDLKLVFNDEKLIIEEIEKWEMNGQQYFSGTTHRLELVNEFRQQTHSLAVYATSVATETDDNLMRIMNDPEKFEVIFNNIAQLKKDMKKEFSEIDKRLVAPDKILNNVDTQIDEEVPTEIKLMADKRSVPLYLKLLKSGSEKKRDIRLVIVGKGGAGKTSLIKRLFSEKNTDSTSTNGIEIHTIKCKATSDDGIWNKCDGNKEESEIHARLLKQYKRKIETSKGEATKPVEDNTRTTILYRRMDESKESQTSSEEPPAITESTVEPPVITESEFNPPETTQQLQRSLEQATRDIETMLKSKVDLHDKEEYATLLLWDFAGDEEFYHTHQTFLSPDAIYLVVTKLNEADDKTAQDLFQLWIDSIHCYSRLEEDINKHDENQRTSNNLDPPIVIVGTWKDAVTSDEKKIEYACRKKLFTFTEQMSKDERGHIRCEYLISNKEDDHTVFQQMRKDILNLARTRRTWNTKYPLKFIQLEKRLQEKKKELPIIAFQEIKDISSETPMPLDNEELMLYLMYHHEIRAIVYFKDLPDYIILDTQWLSDAFKCVVTADKFRAGSIKNQDKWEEFHCKGKLHWEVIEDIFKKEHTMLYKHKEHILNVMEKFDIIIRPNISEIDNAVEKPCYYVPCMIKEEPECDIYEMFNVKESTCKKSSWLCFKFRFLPPHLINHLIASMCRHYEVAEVGTKTNNRKIALFRDSAVFEIPKTTKLLVMKFSNVIQIQVWQFWKQIDSGLYRYIANLVTEKIMKVVTKRFNMSNVKFEKRWECGRTKPESVSESVRRSNEFTKEENTKYSCKTCNTTHEFNCEWSDLQNTTPYEYKKKPGQRGLVVIVNFMFSGTHKERQGSEVDFKNLKHFFGEELQYQVECTTDDMTKAQLQDYLKDMSTRDNAKDYHSFICVIMSHGDKKGIQTKDEFITVDEMQKPFKNKQGGKFNGKPKVFLIQACRGSAEQENVAVSDLSDTHVRKKQRRCSDETCVGQTGTLNIPSGSSDIYATDALSYSSENVPTDADFIVGHATTPGYISIRNICKGAFFIRAFLAVASNRYKDEHIEDILINVRGELASNPEYLPVTGSLAGKCQMGIVESTSRKKFFLK